MEEFNTASDGMHANFPDRFFARIVDTFLDSTGNQGGLVGDARSYLLEARPLLDFALPLMQGVAEDRAAGQALKEHLSDDSA